MKKIKKTATKKVIKVIVKRRPKAKKIQLKPKEIKKVEPMVSEVPETLKVPKPAVKMATAIKPEIIEQPVCYKEEIVVLGKKVKRLNDEKDTDLQFHCGVDDGTTAHFDKSLFK